MARNILVVEDDRNISDLIRMYLEKEGFDVRIAYDGGKAVEEFDREAPDMVLLDIMLPGIDGYELLKQIKPTGTPVIFITAKGSVQDRVMGLRAGADDYLVKPFEIVELIARVESVLRRAGKCTTVYTLGDVTVDTESMLVTKGGEPVTLTRKEYDLLLLFLQNQNVALFREAIYERVWDSDFMGDTRTVDLHVQRLRKKLGWQTRLASIHKVGYRLEGD